MILQMMQQYKLATDEGRYGYLSEFDLSSGSYTYTLYNNPDLLNSGGSATDVFSYVIPKAIQFVVIAVRLI